MVLYHTHKTNGLWNNKKLQFSLSFGFNLCDMDGVMIQKLLQTDDNLLNVCIII